MNKSGLMIRKIPASNKKSAKTDMRIIFTYRW